MQTTSRTRSRRRIIPKGIRMCIVVSREESEKSIRDHVLSVEKGAAPGALPTYLLEETITTFRVVPPAGPQPSRQPAQGGERYYRWTPHRYTCDHLGPRKLSPLTCKAQPKCRRSGVRDGSEWRRKTEEACLSVRSVCLKKPYKR